MTTAQTVTAALVAPCVFHALSCVHDCSIAPLQSAAVVRFMLSIRFRPLFFIRGWCCTAASAHWGASAAALPGSACRLLRCAPGIAGAAAASAIAGCRRAVSGPAPSMRRRKSFQGRRNKPCVNAANSAREHRVAMPDGIGPKTFLKQKRRPQCIGCGARHDHQAVMIEI